MALAPPPVEERRLFNDRPSVAQAACDFHANASDKENSPVEIDDLFCVDKSTASHKDESGTSTDAGEDSTDEVCSSGQPYGPSSTASPSVTPRKRSAETDVLASCDTVFSLDELLTLQLAVRCSTDSLSNTLHQADAHLANLAADCRRLAKQSLERSLRVVRKYSDVALQVAQVVLPDLKLAAHEKEPALAACLMDMVKQWIEGMEKAGEEVQACQDELLRHLEDLGSCLYCSADGRVQSMQDESTSIKISVMRISQILRECNAFLVNLQGSTRQLADQAVDEPPAYFATAIDEYKCFWESLERLCRQYCSDHETALGSLSESTHRRPVNENIRDRPM